MTDVAEERQHLQTLLGLLQLEAEEEAARAKARSERLTPADAEAAGISLVDLVVVEEYAGFGGLEVIKLAKRNRTLALPWTRLRVGSPVVITATSTGVSVGGVVSGLKRDHITVALRGSAEDISTQPSLRLDLSRDEITTARQRVAVQRAIAAEADRLAELRGVFSGRIAPDFDPEPPRPGTATDQDLNPAQRHAVQVGLSAQDVAVIHGPPGTGKTRTLVALIRAAVDRGESVFAVAPSNLAVDNVLERLVAAGVSVVRLGHPARVRPELMAQTLAARVADHEDLKLARSLSQQAFQLRRKADRQTRTRMDRKARGALRFEAKQLLKDARRLERRAVERILDQAAVVCGTTSVDADLLKDRRFDLVALDEAGQSTEPGIWPPVVLADRVVLAGDHRQLPATVVSPEAAAGGLAVSLFERLIHRLDPAAVVQLILQYRMHSDIMSFPNRMLYDGTLQAAPAVAGHLLRQLAGVADVPITQTAVEFVDTAGAGWSEELEPDGESRRNPREAAYIATKVAALIAAGVAQADIGVITPYAAQSRLLRAIPIEDDVDVDTVDGFQGREKEAILISLVRSNEDGELGFLADVRRMNVALTRARRKLIIVGDSATLGGHPFYAALLEHLETIGAYRTVWDAGDVTV